MKKILWKYFILFAGLLLSVTGRSASQAQDEKKEITRLLEQFSVYEFNDTTVARACLDSALALALQLNDSHYLGEVYKNYGWFHQDWYRYYDAMNCFNIALEHFQKISELQGVADMHGNIGTVYADIGDFNKAIQEQHLSYKISEQIVFTSNEKEKMYKAKRTKAYALGNLGNLYKQMDNYEKAIEYQQQCLDIEMTLKDYKAVGSSYLNIGVSYRKIKDFEKALECQFRALEAYARDNYTYDDGKIYNNISLVYLDQGNIRLAEEYILKAIAHDRSTDNHYNMTFSYNNYAEILMKKGKLHEALSYAWQSLEISTANKFTERLIYTHQLLYSIHNELRNYEKALGHHTRYVFLKDSLFSSLKESEMFRKSLMFDLEKDLLADSISRAKQNELVKMKHDQEIHQQRTYTFVGAGGFILMVVIAFQLMRGNRRRQRTNKMLADKNEIITQKSVETEKQKLLIQNKQKEIVDSIKYAKRIQYALLAHDELLQKNLPEHFVLYEPKDIVSGDFYWAIKKDNRFYLAVCDSTGHGVPGAFMSLLNISFLNEAVNEKGIERPDEILNHVRQRLIQNIPDDAKDGMDCILLCKEENNNGYELTYSAANNSPVLISNDTITEYPADKMPVGKNVVMDPFSLYSITLQKGDYLYLKTDGYADQFGGPNGKKFRNKNLLKLLQNNHHLSLNEQLSLLKNQFYDWKGSLEQIDDVCIVGIRF